MERKILREILVFFVSDFENNFNFLFVKTGRISKTLKTYSISRVFFFEKHKKY